MLPNLPYAKTIPQCVVEKMTCPFGHQLLHAGDSFYYCLHRFCGCAFFRHKSKVICISLEEIEELLTGKITKEEVAERELKAYKEREWRLKRKSV